jgi:uncharacterized repeat protein (TIGR01451 family)
VTTTSGTGNITNDNVTLVPGAGNVVTFTVTALLHPAAGATGSTSNTATVGPDTVSPTTPKDNTSTDTLTVASPANVTVQKFTGTFNTTTKVFTPQPSPFTINLGDTGYFEITITNTGGLPATNVVLTDNLDRDPEGSGTGILTWKIEKQDPTTPMATLGSQSGTSPTVLLTWNIGTLGAGLTDTIVVSTDTTPLKTAHGTDPGAPLPTNLFQLDGDAQFTTKPSSGNFSTAPDDWDNVLGFSNPAASPRPTSPNTTPTGKDLSHAFITDGENGPVDTGIFTTGGSKDTNDTTSWRWTNGSVPDKDNLLHAYSAVYDVPGKATGVEDQVLFFGADRFANNGDSNIGFWFFQQPVGPQTGGTFGPGKHTVGDIFVVSAFTQGGAIGTIQVYKWVGGSSPLQLIFNGAPDPSTGVYGIINTSAQTSPWAYTPKSGTAGTFPTGSFFEGGINLSTFGLAGCFTTFLAETRSAQTTSAQLKDFVAGNIATCKLTNTATVTWTGSDGKSHTSTSNTVEIDIAGTGSGSALPASALGTQSSATITVTDPVPAQNSGSNTNTAALVNTTIQFWQKKNKPSGTLDANNPFDVSN